MKRQTLIMLAVFALGTLAALAPGLVIQRKVAKAVEPAGSHRVPFGAVDIELPAGRELAPRRDGAWEIREYQTALGTLRLATEPSRGTPFPETCTAWFGMPRYSPGPLAYEGHGCSWFFKEVPLFGRGAYVMRRQGKNLRLIAFFEQRGTWHWAMLSTRDTFLPVKAAFDRCLGSMRLPDGARPGPDFARAVAPAAREGRYRFVQPLALLFLLPGAILLPVFALVGAIRRRGGRIPAPEVLGGRVPLLLEGGLEIGISRPMQLQFMDGAVGVDGESLTVYTFGTPLLVLPRRALAGRARSGRDWLGAPFVALELEGPLDFRKQRWKYGAWKGPTRLRVYTRDPLRLLGVLA